MGLAPEKTIDGFMKSTVLLGTPHDYGNHQGHRGSKRYIRKLPGRVFIIPEDFHLLCAHSFHAWILGRNLEF